MWDESPCPASAQHSASLNTITARQLQALVRRPRCQSQNANCLQHCKEQSCGSNAPPSPLYAKLPTLRAFVGVAFLFFPSAREGCEVKLRKQLSRLWDSRPRCLLEPLSRDPRPVAPFGSRGRQLLATGKSMIAQLSWKRPNGPRVSCGAPTCRAPRCSHVPLKNAGAQPQFYLEDNAPPASRAC